MRIPLSIGMTLTTIATSIALAHCSAAGPSAAVPGASTASVRGNAPGRNLLYATQGEAAYVYTYPRGKLLGSLGAVGGSLCSDAQGDVFISQYFGGDVLEYAHGAVVPEATLNLPTFAGPCAVDPVTGSVAVTMSGGHGVMIIPHNKQHGWRFAKTYTSSDITAAAFCGYDARGDLFVDGTGNGSAFVLAELPKGSESFEPITVNQSIAKPGPVQWDGTHLAVVDRGSGSEDPVTIYQFVIAGSSASEVGSTKLTDSFASSGIWIQGNRVIATYGKGRYAQGIGIWPYPAGGAPSENFSTASGVDGETVSKARP